MPVNIQETLNSYARLMEAIKQRTDLIDALCLQDRTLPPWAAAELAQLQIRMVCETFAIACLVAHGDIEATQTKKLADAYQADFIMNRLENLHANFYPHPTEQILKDGVVIGWKPVEGEFLTKNELIKVYRSTYEVLHAGNLRTALMPLPRRVSAVEMMAFTSKLRALLNHHNIPLADPPGEPSGPPGPDGKPAPLRYIVVAMQDASDGRPKTHMFVRQRPEELPPGFVHPMSGQ